MTYTLAIDPPAAISSRTELNLNSGAIQTDHTGIDWGEAQIKAYLAEQQYGEGPVSFRVPNRIVTIPLGLGMNQTGETEEEARRKLNQKVGLLQRKGGVLLRQRASGEPLYADIVNASLAIPDVYGEMGGVEPNAVLKLECLPDFYGEEVTLDAIESEGQIDAVLQQGGKQAVIAGDYPARARIVLTNPSAHDQHGLFWGVRATHYDSAATAALTIDASKMTPINGAKEGAHAGAYEGKWINMASPEAKAWRSILTTDLAATKAQLTHVGSYKVWARVWAAEQGMRVRLLWALNENTVQTANSAVSIPRSGAFYLVDLGNIRIEQPPVGIHWWRGTIQVESGANSHAFAVDRLWVQPLDNIAARASSINKAWVPNEIETNATWAHSGTKWESEDGNILDIFNGVWATVTLAASASSAALVFKGFARGVAKGSGSEVTGFELPEGAEIKGFALTFEYLMEGTSAAATLYPRLAYKSGLSEEGSIVGEESPVTLSAGSPTIITVGGQTALWGSSLTVAQINAAWSFGCAMWAIAGAAGATVKIKDIEMRVFYKHPGAISSEDAVLYSSREAQIRHDGAFREGPETTAMSKMSQPTGDLFRLPPSGIEKAPVELLVKGSHGDFKTEPDDTIDTLKAQVLYQPCYLGRI